MKIYTSYFAMLRKIPKDIVPIAICAYPPKWYDGLVMEKLAPTKSVLFKYKNFGDVGDMIKGYKKETLDSLIVKDVIEEVRALTGGKDAVFLCFEKTGEICHRHFLAEYFQTKGYIIREWWPEN